MTRSKPPYRPFVLATVALAIACCAVVAMIFRRSTDTAAPCLSTLLAGRQYDAADALLASGESVDVALDLPGNTALTGALVQRDEDATRWLLERGADPNRRRIVDAGGAYDTPLIIALGAGCDGCADQLLSHGANPSAATRSGFQSIHMAARNSSTTMMDVLISHGAILEAKEFRGRGVLHYAGSEDMVSYLCGHGVDPNMADFEGVTPLHAAILSKPEVVRSLLDCGANTGLRNVKGMTARDELAKFLKSARNHRKEADLIANLQLLDAE